MIHVYKYRSESMLISNSASIDHSAQAIHHRIMLPAIHQHIKAPNKLCRENQILSSSFLCNTAISSGMDNQASSIIPKNIKFSE